MLLGTYAERACRGRRARRRGISGRNCSPDLDRDHARAPGRVPALPGDGTTGIRRVVNGPFTFAPDGNPLVGPGSAVCAASGRLPPGVAGLSQGGGVVSRLALVTAGDHGDSGMDIWGHGCRPVRRDYATPAYTNAKVRENYARRFRITFPNEGTPRRPPASDDADPRPTRLALNACLGATFGLEHALWFQAPGLPPVEDVTFRRSNAWSQVAAEVAAVRERVGMTEISNYAKYRVTARGARGVLSNAADRPAAGAGSDHPDRDAQRGWPDRRRVHGRAGRRCPRRSVSSSCSGRVPPRSTTSAAGSGTTCPADGSVRFEVLGLGLVGLSVTGRAHGTCSRQSRRTLKPWTSRPRRSRS